MGRPPTQHPADDLVAAALPDLLAQPARWQALAGAAGSAPPDPAQSPWASHWATCCHTGLPAAQARQLHARNLAAFDARGQSAGALLSIAAAIATFYVDEGPLAPLDDWVALLQARLPAHGAWSSAALEAQVMACGLAITLRDQQHPLLQAWATRGEVLLRQLPCGAARMKLATFLLQYHLWRGELAAATQIVDSLPGLDAGALLPADALAWHQSLATHARFTGRHAQGMAEVQAALALADAHGLQQHHYALHAHGATLALAAQQADAAAAHLAAMQPILAAQPQDDQTHYWHLHTGLHLLRGHTAAALVSARSTLANSLEIGGPYRTGVHRLSLGQALLLHGDAAAAATELAQAADLADGIGAGLLAYSARLVLAEAWHRSGQAAPAADLLRRTLADGARQAYPSMAGWWLPALMAPLLARALAEGIETEHASAWVRRSGLACPHPGQAAWPWPLALRGLGRFQVLRFGHPLDGPATQAAQRPLDLLRALLAAAPHPLPVATALQWLWPDSGADQRKAFDVALLRLRRLLGDDSLLRLEGGKLQLAPDAVWTDAGALAALLSGPAPGSDAAALRRHTDQALALLRGPLLPDQPGIWAVAARERLRQRTALALGGWLDALQAQDADAALHALETAVDRDPACEALARRLMRWHAQRRQPGEAGRVYRQLAATLALASGQAPSPESRALAASLGLDADLG